MELTTGGMIFLVLAWGTIIALTAFSFYKVLKGENKKL
jgi:hypothetical protein